MRLATIVLAATLVGFAAPDVPVAAVEGSTTAAGEPSAEPPAPQPVVALGDAPALDVSFGGAPVDISPTPTGEGFWLVNADGEVGAYGDAAHHDDLTTISTGDSEAVALEATPSGEGYLVLDAAGGVFAFGDAAYHGSIPELRASGLAMPHTPAVAIEATPSGEGYLVLDAAGGVFGFGDAAYHGSIPELRRSGVAVGAGTAADLDLAPGGDGYRILDRAGGVFTFGDAAYHGSIPELRASGLAMPHTPAVAIETTSAGGGYWVLDAAGGVFTFGDAPFLGSSAGRPGEAVGLAPAGGDAGYWVARAQGVDAPPLPAASGSGHRVVYCNSCQRVWLVGEHDVVVRSYQVSGRRGVPAPGDYEVFSKSRVSVDASHTLRLDHMTRFAHGRTLAIGFHGIPIHSSTGEPIQTNDELGQYRSAGCVRQAHEDAKALWDFAPVGTPVIVTP